MRSRTGWVISFSGLPSPVPWSGGRGIVYALPSYWTRSRFQTWRQISMISRVRVSGLS